MYAIIETGGKQYKVSEGDESKLRSLLLRQVQLTLLIKYLQFQETTVFL